MLENKIGSKKLNLGGRKFWGPKVEVGKIELVDHSSRPRELHSGVSEALNGLN